MSPLDQFDMYLEDSDLFGPLKMEESNLDFAFYSELNGLLSETPDSESVDYQLFSMDSPTLTVASSASSVSIGPIMAKDSAHASNPFADQYSAFAPLEGFEQLSQNWQYSTTADTRELESAYLNLSQCSEPKIASTLPPLDTDRAREKVVEKRKKMALDGKKLSIPAHDHERNTRKLSLSPTKSFKYKSKSIMGSPSTSSSPTNPFYKPPDVLWKLCNSGSSKLWKK
ncbi:hypothetical protein OGAPHI_004819 [Ogataea philodendri]|uniref:Uncharacterized protein n=1 Tax=Ogataea philodendri TaxID=1378263 RepID=A0A9P8P2X4_9ASCO|nr:uncharacterized protein OGAPHI_004819 [Ogataea philodendri]KAH3664105.1 hypothetical protein OGAPHI_004819 [Ogataea philodendri]